MRLAVFVLVLLTVAFNSLVSCFSYLKENENYAVTLSPRIPKRIEITDEHVIQLQLLRLPFGVTFVLFEAHTYESSLTISLAEELISNRYTNGTNVGLVELLNEEHGATCYLWCSECQRNTTVFVKATPIFSNEPVPGACNEEFSLELYPNLNIPQRRFIHPVQFQYANIQSEDMNWYNCEDKTQQRRLVYEVYQLFLDERQTSEEYFLDTIEDLLNLTQFLEQASLIETIKYGGQKTEVKFAAYHGQGVMYRVVVKKDNLTSVSYVPVLKFSCEKNDGYCEMNTKGIITLQILSSFLGAFGIFLCYAGHKYLKLSMFIFGFLGFILIFISIFMKFTSLSTMGGILTAGSIGIIGGLIWFAVWFFYGIPIISVLMPGLVMGYLISSIVFVTTPLDNLSVLHGGFNYGMCFACGILLPVVFLLAFSRLLHIMATACVGSYLVVFAIDWFVFGSIRHLVVISIKKSISTEFLQVYNNFPFQLSDLVLSILWVVMCLSGLLIQYKRERRQPYFPPCPWKELQQRQRLSGLSTQEYHEGDDETTPILTSQGFRRYASQEEQEQDFFNSRQRRFRTPSSTQHNTSIQQEVAGFFEESPHRNREIVDPI